MDCEAAGGGRLRTLQLRISSVRLPRDEESGLVMKRFNLIFFFFSFHFLWDRGLKRKAESNLLIDLNL